jgi:hypothetical protein
LFRVLKSNEADLVESVRSIGDKFSDEDLLLGVETVDNDVHESAHICVKGELLVLSL